MINLLVAMRIPMSPYLDISDEEGWKRGLMDLLHYYHYYYSICTFAFWGRDMEDTTTRIF